jgi:hypothetical protein
MPDVRLVDLEVIRRFSLAVRADTVPADELLEALDASRAVVLAAMNKVDAPKPRPAKAAGKAPAKPAKQAPAKAAPSKAPAKPAKKAAPRKAAPRTVPARKAPARKAPAKR